MGRKKRLEQEEGRRIDNRRNGPGDNAALRLLFTLLLLLRLGCLLALLRLFGLLAGLPPDGLAANRPVGTQGRQGDRDEKLPLHAADVTTPLLNRK
jgi:hypothetical protein